MRKTVAIIQARVGSTRLPGKVLKEICGKPMLWYVIERVKRARLINEIVVATTTNAEDDEIVKIAEQCRVKTFRGSEDDVLDRYYRAAKEFKADVVVRITADCPLIDPEIVDKTVEFFLKGDFDYVSNTVRPTFPDGLDVEVFSFDALKKAWENATKLSEREHVTPYIRKHPEKFKIGSFEAEHDLSHLRWTVDREEDLRFVREVYERIGKEIFHMQDVLELLREHPELAEINRGIKRNEGYEKSLREDREIVKK
ncbi:MAG: glycosyltransferase family protein [Candidatus Hadarchaeales archaeon]